MMSIAPEFNNAPSPGFSPRSPDTIPYIVFDRVFYIVMASTCTLLVFFMVCTFCICKRIRAREGPAFIAVEKRIPFSKNRNAWTFPQIEEATDNFSIDRCLGRGRHGRVYAATLPDGQVMAVKRIDPALVLRHKPDFSLSAEIRALSRVQHPNIVPVLGFCESPAEKILVMEYMPRNTLQYHLHEGGIVFDWGHRLRIAIEAAQGIEYLHEGTNPYTIHGYIKSSNILLDLNWCARVSDFGLSFLAPPSDKFGTGRACCPVKVDYKSKASDIYNFGIVLLEILSGRPSCSGGISIVGWAVDLVTKSRAHEIFDPKLQLPGNLDPLIRAAELACQCVNEVRSIRPPIIEVVVILKKIKREINMA